MIGSILRRIFGSERGERGQVLAVAAMFIVVMAGAASMAIDLGSYISHRRSLQNSADAIALAASLNLPAGASAQSTANEWATKNGVEISSMTITITPQSLPSEPNPKITIEIQAEHNLTFTRLVGLDTAGITVTATAIITSPGGSDGLTPWSVLEDVKNGAAPGDLVVLKYDSNNVQSGNFGALRIDGNGAKVYKNTIKYGSDNGLCVSGVPGCDDLSIVETEPGNMTGPTRKGSDYRLNNTTLACDTWEETVIENADGTQWIRPECNPFTAGGNEDSLRLIIVPVIETLCNGACYVTVVEFALFFLEGFGAGGCTGNDCEIEGRFIQSNTNYGALMGVYDEDTFSHFVRLVN